MFIHSVVRRELIADACSVLDALDGKTVGCRVNAVTLGAVRVDHNVLLHADLEAVATTDFSEANSMFGILNNLYPEPFNPRGES